MDLGKVDLDPVLALIPALIPAPVQGLILASRDVTIRPQPLFLNNHYLQVPYPLPHPIQPLFQVQTAMQRRSPNLLLILHLVLDLILDLILTPRNPEANPLQFHQVDPISISILISLER